jgi:ADP-heptose:LPS heptosyltransferase
MTRILLTRLGGLGDLLFIEPIIRAIYEKHKPCEIVFRTYIDFYDVLTHHPLISDVVCDTADYYLGYYDELKPKESPYWRGINSFFDLHFDFQGVLEKGVKSQDPRYEMPMSHAIAKHMLLGKNITLNSIIPQIHFSKQNVPSYNIVAQLRANEEDRCLHENKEILQTLSKYENYHIIGEEKLNYHEFISIIDNCNLFIGTESCGTLIARGLNKQTIGFYTNNSRKNILSFDKVTQLTFNQTHKLEEAIDSYESVQTTKLI